MKNKRANILFLLPLLLTSCGKQEHPVSDYRLTMNFHDDFKIMQWTDVHIGIQTDLKKTHALLKAEVDDFEEKEGAKPDLIVLTGDTFMGADRRMVKDTLKFFDSLEVPFAFTYGNHDIQGDYGTYYINNQLKKCKNAVFVDYQDDTLFGLTNYFIDLVSDDYVKYRLFILDSNSYYLDGTTMYYDVFHEEQIEHIEKVPTVYGSATSLAFYHIPVFEFLDAYNCYQNGTIHGTGENKEGVSRGYENQSQFDRMVNAGIKGMFIGHDHINDTTLLYEGCILSYGMKSTFEIYNLEIGYTVITLDESGVLNPSDVKKVTFEGGDYE